MKLLSMDFIGRVMLTLVFTILAALKATTLIVLLTAWRAEFLLIATGEVFGLIFMIMVIVLTAIRLPPKSETLGWVPRIVAIMGTFMTLSLLVLPRGIPSPEIAVIGLFLIILGTALSSYCLFFLGRSFSIDAQARQLVTGGPYALVRHPLYLSEAVVLVGVVAANPSVWSVTLILGVLGLQYWRARNEERVLELAFPEYAAYADRTPMLVPALRMRRAAS